MGRRCGGALRAAAPAEPSCSSTTGANSGTGVLQRAQQPEAIRPSINVARRTRDAGRSRDRRVGRGSGPVTANCFGGDVIDAQPSAPWPSCRENLVVVERASRSASR